MQFTEEDVPLMKLILNPETHAMGMMIGRERAEKIFVYVCNEIKCSKEDFIYYTSDFFERILRDEDLSNFFWDNNILQLSFLDHYDVGFILQYSPTAEKIWDSGKLDLSKLNGDGISNILVYSPITEKIWDSGKLDLTKLDGDDIYWILTFSPIAKKIWDSGKLNLSLVKKKDLDYFKQKFESKCN